MGFGKRIKQRRLELGLSADELGKMIGKNRATIYRYEKGDIESIPTDILEPLAMALNTTPMWIMGWTRSNSYRTKDGDVRFVDSIGETIKNLRNMQRLTLEEFSVETGISVDDLKSYENGNREIPEDMMGVIAKPLHVTVGDLKEASIAINGAHLTNIRQIKFWRDEMGKITLTHDELMKIIHYGKYLVYSRDH